MADLSIPNYFYVELDGACVLPDGAGMPAVANGVSTTWRYEKPNALVVTCSGKLPAGAVIPRVPTKFTYNETGLMCVGMLKGTIRQTTGYGAVVYPAGWSQITCGFDLTATDP